MMLPRRTIVIGYCARAHWIGYQLLMALRASSSAEICFGPVPVFVKLYPVVDRELEIAEPDRIETLEILEFIPEESVDPIYLGKAILLGPDEHSGGIDGYATFVDALAETRTAAVGVLYGRTRDRRVVIQPYRERGLLLRELFDTSKMRAIEEVELPRSVRGSLMPGAFELWTGAIEGRRGGRSGSSVVRRRGGARDRRPGVVDDGVER